MSDPIMDELQRRFRPMLDKLGYLHDRWQDEQQYEDWNDYIAAMRELAPADTEFVKASKRPFGYEVRTKSGGGFRFFAAAGTAGFHILRDAKKIGGNKLRNGARR